MYQGNNVSETFFLKKENKSTKLMNFDIRHVKIILQITQDVWKCEHKFHISTLPSIKIEQCNLQNLNIKLVVFNFAYNVLIQCTASAADIFSIYSHIQHAHSNT